MTRTMTERLWSMATPQMTALDLDQQVCDPAWLEKAMPDWFQSGGNIREMHGLTRRE
jgi:hypothetical protein